MEIERSYVGAIRPDWAEGTYASANEAWENLYYCLNTDGDESSPRGMKVRETLGCNIIIVNPKDNLVYSEARKLSPYYLAGEYFWYKSGNNNWESIYNHSKFWKKIANEDGTVNSNYGKYVFKEGQWDKIVETLKNDPDSRQAVLQIPIPENFGTKDVPCTSSVQFLVRDGKLFCTTYMRSCDIWLGFPYDVFQFTMWQIELAKELGVELGWYRHVVGSLHVYEKQFSEKLFENGKVLSTRIKEGCYDRTSKEFMNDLVILDSKCFPQHNEVLKFMTRNYEEGKTR